ncbi:MAG: prolipoprotein diacylglyceryl transferase [Alphaproteobacteria bacterium]|nr:prolipoprotein diacylglyceryl transferase [Alphaproteobacteria bacterium]
MIGLTYPEISPVIFSIGPLAVRWYSMAYLAGILLGWWMVSSRVKKYNIGLTKENLEDLVFYVTLGIILGGRFGYILFYGQEQYLQNPLEIFAIWHGGMSFHGGIIGVIIALWLAARKLKFSFLKITDLVAAVTPIGIFFGRLANFVNDELWGRVTDVAWAVRFPNGGYLPRHPSQIYEACLEGILLFCILNLLWKFKYCRENEGTVSGVFLLGYAVVRMVGEQFREPDAQIGFLMLGTTMGQLLSIPAVLLGGYLLVRPLISKKAKPLS